MNPYTFIDVPFDSEEAWGPFQLAHGLTHQTVYNAMLRRGLVPLFYPLMDFPRMENGAYLLDHWETHLSNAALLRIPTGVADLSTADFNDPPQFEDWLQLHALIHAAENQALGLR